jgi:hypothetical protein
MIQWWVTFDGMIHLKRREYTNNMNNFTNLMGKGMCNHQGNRSTSQSTKNGVALTISLELLSMPPVEVLVLP